MMGLSPVDTLMLIMAIVAFAGAIIISNLDPKDFIKKD